MAILPASGHRRMRWANGGGWTTEILAWPSAEDWQWRVSVADVDAAGPFSKFPGIDRTIALLRGNGFALVCGTDAEAVIDRPFEPFGFPGDVPTTCRLLDGPVQDLNLMVRRTARRRRLRFVTVDGDVELPEPELPEPELVVVVAGSVRIDGVAVAPLDAFRSASRRGVTASSVGSRAAVLAVVAG